MTLFLILLFALTPGALADPWDSSNAPSRFTPPEAPYETRFEALPLSGSSDPDRIPWSETYWPSNEGSINIRWNAPGRPGFGLRSPTLEELKKKYAMVWSFGSNEMAELGVGHYNTANMPERVRGLPRVKAT